MLIEWSDELSVGIQEIDEQHKALVGLVNDMHDAIQQHHGSEVTSDILQRLAEYTKNPFCGRGKPVPHLRLPRIRGPQEAARRVAQ